MPVLGDSMEGLVLLPGHVEGDMISWDAGESPGDFLANDDAEGGTMFFRVNPGVQHNKPEAKWIEFFAWNVPFIIELSEIFNLKVLDIRDDSNQRKYFIYRK